LSLVSWARRRAESHAATSPHTWTADDGLDRLSSGPSGLSDAEARRRLQEHGANVLPTTKPRSAWLIVLDQLRSAVVLLLCAAAAVAVITGDLTDAAAIGVVLLINTTLGFVTELRARRAMESLVLAEVLVLLVAAVVGLPLPLLPLQILWMNIVTDTFPALSLAVEPADRDAMQLSPRDPDEGNLLGGFRPRDHVVRRSHYRGVIGRFLDRPSDRCRYGYAARTYDEFHDPRACPDVPFGQPAARSTCSACARPCRIQSRSVR
jgi:hypothetical protein